MLFVTLPILVWFLIGFLSSESDWIRFFKVSWWLCKWVVGLTLAVVLACWGLNELAASTWTGWYYVQMGIGIPLLLVVMPLNLVLVGYGWLIALGIVPAKPKPAHVQKSINRMEKIRTR